MAKYFIFDTGTGDLARLADTDAKKDNFTTGQVIYTTVVTSDSDYASVKDGTKKVSLVDGSAVLTEIGTTEYNLSGLAVETLEGTITSSPATLDDIKTQIKEYIRSQIIAWENSSNDTEVINALNNIDVDSITEAPTVGLLKWTLSQSGVPQKVWFEL